MTDAADSAPVGSSAPRVDAHYHLWDLGSGRYSWPTPAEAPIYRTFTPQDLAPELHASAVDATVVVQATDSLADTDSTIEAAAAFPWIAGVVGWLPLADRRIAEHELEKRRGRLSGVRHLIHWDPDPMWLVRLANQPGLALLAEAGLPFDVVAVYPNHLPLVPAVAAAHPDLRLVIDHLAKPPFRGDGWDHWVDAIRRAAQSPNVYAKLSGLDTAAGPDWTVDELRPAWEIALESFGPERLLFGTDWPVCRLVSTYGEVVAATRTLVSELSVNEQERVMGDTAIEVYALSPGAAASAPGAG